MKTMRKMFGISVMAAFIILALAACNHDGGGGGDNKQAYVLNVSEDTETEWDLLVLGNDGSSTYLKMDEETGKTAQMVVIPDNKKPEVGVTYLFKTNGLVDKIIVNDYIVYFGNYNGYKVDLAVIKPNGTIEYFGICRQK